MSFGTIVTSTTTFEDRGNGLYMDPSKAFGEPSNSLKVRSNVNAKAPSVALTRVKQLDYSPNALVKTVRIFGSVQVIITIPPAGFSPAEVDAMLAEINQFATAATLSEMLQGKS